MDGASVKEGKVIFDGQNGWASLPIGKTIEQLTNATFETRFTWDEMQAPWARIFDFGSSSSSYMFFTVINGRAQEGAIAGTPRFAISTRAVTGEKQLTAKQPLAIGKLTHVVITIDADHHVGKLFINGEEVASRDDMTVTPSDLGETTANLLGASQWDADPLLHGSITEFRIYDTALSADDVAKNFKAGPDELGIKPDADRPAAEKSPPAAIPDGKTSGALP